MLSGGNLLDLIVLAKAAVNPKQHAEKKGEKSKIDVLARASASQLMAQLHWQHGPDRMHPNCVTTTVLKCTALSIPRLSHVWDDYTSAVQYDVATT